VATRILEVAEVNVIRAAGGVVVRRSRSGETEIAVVHRPEYDDWTLPKGKLDPGESWEEAARREVEEETCLRCEPGEEVGRTYYEDARGRPKEVRYFLMEADGEPAPCNEVDEVRWVPLEEARAALTYERDRDLVTQVTNQRGS
jgi:8-oxo-dGTP diphosphatase